MVVKMSVKESLLKALLEGETVSGTELADSLKVSRNAVWKAVDSLRKDGYTIQGQTNSGYKLTKASENLSKPQFEKYIKHNNLDIHVYDTIGSTNTSLKEWALKGKNEGTVIISQEQTEGRGRLGRRFLSPQSTGIYFSILLRPRFSAEHSLCITTAAAVAVSDAIEELSGEKAYIKWVNDIFVKDKKVCGILTEASIDFESGGLDYAVLGIGINVFEPDGGFGEELNNIAGAVFDKREDGIRQKICAKVIDNFFDIYENLPNNDYIVKYQNRSYLNNKEVKLSVGRETVSGVVVGVDDSARLMVKLENGELRAFNSGEASIIKRYNK